MKCENCNNKHHGKYGSGRFCGLKCARGFSTKSKRLEINRCVSEKLVGRKLSEEHKKNILAGYSRSVIKQTRYCKGCNTEMYCRPSDKRKFCTSLCWAKFTEKYKEPFLLYRQRCNFTFNVKDFPEKFDLSIIKKIGRYSPSNKGNNINGVSKDHMFSIKNGFDQKVDPEIISHPANCKILLHRDNQRKHSKSSITLEELLIRIDEW